ncbi:7-cyano-7-deazaguanine synthase [Paraburkholderia sp. SOS3]|uniref:7-cyano-7-deazaguanine synthase n=1 Tax=Paraburkholderia sp. SOS3 TaxID=1926494 RepID=UPI00094757A9|nr:7-cyano-7-deazaguanine synthase [Paraburkholderia sp. SOS3]APR34939.1 7-cyano-7-deazaguanine synthase [Paraburkholderia sp. SOS3]
MSSLLLLSGGIDSICLAYWYRPDICLTVAYGQVAAAAEIQASAQVCFELSLRHEIVHAEIPRLGSGTMAGEASSPHSAHEEFWPFRNQYLITLAAMLAINQKCDRVIIGTVATDVRHADGSSAFVQTMSKVLSIQEGQILLEAPAIGLSSVELIVASRIPYSLLAWAHSCHAGSFACGQCPGCVKHSLVMNELGIDR